MTPLSSEGLTPGHPGKKGPRAPSWESFWVYRYGTGDLQSDTVTGSFGGRDTPSPSFQNGNERVSSIRPTPSFGVGPFPEPLYIYLWVVVSFRSSRVTPPLISPTRSETRGGRVYDDTPTCRADHRLGCRCSYGKRRVGTEQFRRP